MIPRSWSTAKRSELNRVSCICLDIDDTFSTHGKITASAFQSLWNLKNTGFTVVPITGRPAGWCDHIARFWPIDAVVGENGAFTFFMEKGIRKRIDTPGGEEVAARQRKLKKLKNAVLKAFPKTKWASDQNYREFDLAIDICEDVKPWSKREIDSLLQLCKDAGAKAKLSSVHVNAWFGDYDKSSGFRHWLSQGCPGLKGRSLKMDQCLFIGDSPNDEPLFASFPYSIGVANLKRYLPDLTHPPTWITQSESGKGFSEMTRKICYSLSGE